MTHLLVGLLLAGLGVWGMISWWDTFGLVMRGVVPFSLLVVGLIAIVAGYRRSAQSIEVPLASAQLELDPRVITPAGLGLDYEVELAAEREEATLKAS